MKKPLFTFLPIVLILFAFSSCETNSEYTNWGSGVKGEGDIITKELSLDAFTGIQVGASSNVYLTKGNTQKVTVEGQANIIELLKTDVADNTWKIGFTKNVRNYKSLKVYITIPTVHKLRVSGSGNVYGESKFTDLGDVETSVSGSGNIEVELEAKDINGGISGSGNMTLKGAAEGIDLRISGSGSINAIDMEVATATVTVSGSGKAKVHVRDMLDVRISGSGDVYYKGQPKIKSKISGSGDLEAVDS